MAALLARFGSRQCYQTLRRCTPITQQICSLKTTNKKGETVFPGLHPDYKKHQEQEDPFAKDENWISHGYNTWNRDKDTFEKHTLLFTGVTLGLMGTMFVIWYLPDMQLRDWSQREALLLIAERDAKGLPLIDPNYIPVEKMEAQLPTDEELGETKIIV